METTFGPKKGFIPDDIYAIIEKSMPITGVEAAITMGNSILLMKRRNHPARGMWWFCGGRLHHGESILECLHREVMEETGLVVKVEGFIGVFNRVFPQRHDITLVYKCTCPDGSRVSMDDEHSEWGWFETLPSDLHPFLLETIAAVNDDDVNRKGRKGHKGRAEDYSQIEST